MSNRYLSAPEKAETLEEWRILLESPPISGPGAPDLEIVPWCEKINALVGVCTIQSCAGHGPDKRGYRSSGHLWLRFDEQLTHRLNGRAFGLARLSAIERISIIYQPWGKEVVEIEFKGNPYGMLDESLGAILSFLRGLQP